MNLGGLLTSSIIYSKQTADVLFLSLRVPFTAMSQMPISLSPLVYKFNVEEAYLKLKLEGSLDNELGKVPDIGYK